MNIGLVDVDGHNFPNYALMKISAWHKAQGDHVEWWNGLCEYDKVYMSKVFTFSDDLQYPIKAREIIKGGTGYKNYGSLPGEIDAAYPDYSIYKDFQIRNGKRWEPYAIGFLTRGCIRNCPWCIVPRKEGYIRPYRTWQEVQRPGVRNIVFMDNNVLASGWGLEQIEQIGAAPVWIDFNQGLDARLITPEIARMLARVHWIRYVRMSTDTEAMLPVVERAAAYLTEAGISRSRLYSYVLVMDVEDAKRRVLALDKLGFTCFAQPYRDYEGGVPTAEQERFAQWVNRRWQFVSCDFEHFSPQGRREYRRAK